MAIIFICLLILFFIYIIKGRNTITFYIQAILKNKNVYINNRKSMMKKNNIIKQINDIKNKPIHKKKKKKISKKKISFNNKNKKKNPPIKKKRNLKINNELNINQGRVSSLNNL